MKSILLVLVTFFAAANVQADSVVCQDQVKADVAKAVGEGKQVNSVELIADFQQSIAFKVEVGLAMDIDTINMNLPARAVYNVLVLKTSSLGDCLIVESKKILDVQ